eukprot:GHVL01022715.1.p1 GENE.GHVL01022715.1~~GHVL01022715.1.p1  ORF type:complete len:286 (-),score=37.22 GHVL01022715.1:17-874(-)
MEVQSSGSRSRCDVSDSLLKNHTNNSTISSSRPVSNYGDKTHDSFTQNSVEIIDQCSATSDSQISHISGSEASENSSNVSDGKSVVEKLRSMCLNREEKCALLECRVQELSHRLATALQERSKFMQKAQELEKSCALITIEKEALKKQTRYAQRLTNMAQAEAAHSGYDSSFDNQTFDADESMQLCKNKIPATPGPTVPPVNSPFYGACGECEITTFSFASTTSKMMNTQYSLCGNNGSVNSSMITDFSHIEAKVVPDSNSPGMFKKLFMPFFSSLDAFMDARPK